MASCRFSQLVFLFVMVSSLRCSFSLTVSRIREAAAAGARTELAELQPGVKYATNRRPYRFSQVPVQYQGAVYFRGDNDKTDRSATSFHVDRAVRVFVAIDTRKRRDVATFPAGWTRTPHSLIFTHNGKDQIGFHVYQKDYSAGYVSFRFKNGPVMAGTFLMQRKGLPGPKLTEIVQSAEANAPTVVARLQAGSFYKYATNRARYFFRAVPREYENAIYLRGDNDKLTLAETSFLTDVPVTVFVAIDTRSGRDKKTKPRGFQSTGRHLLFTHNGRDAIPFRVYSRSFPAGQVQFSYKPGSKAVMAGIFVMRGKRKKPKKHLTGIFEKKYSLVDVFTLCRSLNGLG